MKKFVENGAWAYPENAQCFEYPLLSQERIKLRTSNLAGIFTGSIRTKGLKILGENGAWAYPGTAQVFWVPPIILGTGKTTNFKFCTHILSIDRNKSPLQISGKVAGCIVRTLKTSQLGHLCIGRIAQLSCFWRRGRPKKKNNKMSGAMRSVPGPKNKTKILIMDRNAVIKDKLGEYCPMK